MTRFESENVPRESAVALAKQRVYFFDIVRGFAVISMVAFHATYDVAYLYGINVPWFTSGPLQELWRISISWTFLAVAGWMTVHSRNNVRRALVYGAAALVIWIATSIAAVDQPISFGIIFCMAGCTAIWAALERVMPRALDRCPPLLIVLLFVLFLAAYQVPRSIYAVQGFAWLGFPYAGFSSSDYYPLIPFSLLYLASALAARRWRQRGGTYPTWMMKDRFKLLSLFGRASLWIYLLHQEVILIVLNVVLGS